MLTNLGPAEAVKAKGGLGTRMQPIACMFASFSTREQLKYLTIPFFAFSVLSISNMDIQTISLALAVSYDKEQASSSTHLCG
jgi:hypothetical protein